MSFAPDADARRAGAWSAAQNIRKYGYNISVCAAGMRWQRRTILHIHTSWKRWFTCETTMAGDKTEIRLQTLRAALWMQEKEIERVREYLEGLERNRDEMRAQLRALTKGIGHGNS
jgi:uncharacterized coiled-coil protein SlyX